MANGTTNPFPLSKDEQKGLLYGSLIAAGISAMSGRNLGEGLQRAVLGFGAGYSGGLANMLKMKEEELAELRQQEEMRLAQIKQQMEERRLGIEEENLEINKQFKDMQTKRYELENRLMQNKQNYLEQAGGSLRQGNKSAAIDFLTKAGEVDAAIRLIQGSERGVVSTTDLIKSYEDVLGNINKDTINQLKILHPDVFGSMDANQGLQLVKAFSEGNVPEGVSPDKMQKVMDDYLRIAYKEIDNRAYLDDIHPGLRPMFKMNVARMIAGIKEQPATQPQPTPKPSEKGEEKSPARKKAEDIFSEFKKTQEGKKPLWRYLPPVYGFERATKGYKNQRKAREIILELLKNPVIPTRR